MIVSIPKILGDNEHEGKVFDSVGYQNALKQSGYTHSEAKDWWSKNPTGITMMPNVGVTLDKNTGKITVTAPETLSSQQSFKDTFKDSDLEMVSRLYKSSPEAKIETSEGEEVTAEEIVKSYDDAIKQYAKNYNNLMVIRSLLTEDLGDNANNISEKHLAYMNAGGAKQEDDEALLSIPKSVVAQFPKIGKLSSYNMDSVLSKNFYEEYYNLGKTDRDELIKLRKFVDDYFDRKEFSDIDEYSKMLAFRNFLYQYEPSANFWQSAGLAIEARTEGAARATAGFTAGLMSIVQGASDLLVNTMEGATGLLASAFGEEYTPKKPSEVDFDLINTGINAVFGTEYLNEELQNQYNDRSEYYYALNRTSATVFALSHLITSVAENVIAGAAFGRIIENYASAVAMSKIYNTAYAAKYGANAMAAGNAATGWQVMMQSITGTTNPSLWQTLKALSTADTAKIFSGAKAFIGALSNLEGSVADANLSKLIAYSTRVMKTGKGVATGANFIAQVTLDTTLASPTAMRKIISGDASEEDKQVYLREVAWNAGGYAAGILLAKMISAFPKSKVGQAANAWATQKVASARTTFRDMSDSFKTKVFGEDWLNNISNPAKRQVARYNAIIAEANRNIANATSDIGSTAYAASQTDAVKEARKIAIAVQNAVDDAEAGIRYYINQYMGGNIKDPGATYYPALTEGMRKALSGTVELNKALKAAGISANAKPTALINGVSSNLGDPQDIVNYVHDVWAKKYLENKKIIDGSLNGDEEKGLEIARRRAAAVEDKYPSSITSYIKDKYIPYLENAYYQLNVHRSELHLESAAIRQGRTASGYFGEKGEKWIHMSAVTEFQKRAAENTNNLSRTLSGFKKVDGLPDDYHYSWGKEVDYVHPELALQNYAWETAQLEHSQNNWDAFSPVYKDKTSIAFNAKQGDAAQVYENLKGDLNRKSSLDKASGVAIKGISQKLNEKNVIERVVESSKAKETYEKMKRKADVAKSKVKELATKQFELSQKDKLSTAMTLPEEYIPDVMGDELTEKVAATEEEWKKMVKGLTPKGRSGIKEIFMDSRALTGYSFDDYLSNVEEISGRIKKNLMSGANFWPNADSKFNDISRFKVYDFGKKGKAVTTAGKSYKLSNKKILNTRKEDGALALRDLLLNSPDKELRDLGNKLVKVPKKTGKPVISTKALAKKSDDFYKRFFRELSNYGLNGVALYGKDAKEALVSAKTAKEMKIEATNDMLGYFNHPLTYESYKNAALYNENINTEIDRVRIQTDKKLWDNEKFIATAQEQKRAKAMFEADTTLRESLRQLNLPTTNDEYEAVLASKEAIDIYKTYLLNDPGASSLIDAVAVNVSEDNLDVARDYIALKTLYNNRGSLKSSLIKEFNKAKFSDDFKKLGPREVENRKNAFISVVMGELKNELEDARNILQEAGDSIVDTEDVFAEIKELAKEIGDTLDEEGAVARYDSNGQLVIYRTDPILGEVMNYQPILTPTKAEMIFGNPVFRTMNRVARFAQINLNPTSYKNQFMRDPSLLYFSTGTHKFMGMVSGDLQIEYDNKWAEMFIDDMNERSPSTYEYLTDLSKKSGQDMKELVINRYLSYGKITSPAETPTEFYRKPFDKGEGVLSMYKKTRNAFAKAGDKMLKAGEFIHFKRESTLRNASYASGFHDALEMGYTVREAENQAKFFQRNGTTNFNRQLYHFRCLQKTVNYFGAGINGFTSFWRLFSLDPIGVSTRIFGGLVIPTIVATAVSLSNEENREKYIHIPEYYKKNQFVFMMNGELYRIPIPQDLYMFVAPIRQAVESYYESNRNEFEELLLSDILNIGPVDFSGVLMLDRDRLLNNSPTFIDRARALGLDLIDQTMPNAVKLAFETLTNIDTYTGDKIDNSYYIIDDDNNRTLVGSTHSSFALQVAKRTGASPDIIAHVTKSLLGQVGEDILDVVFGGDDVSGLLEKSVTDLTSFEASDYDRIKAEWNSAIGDLWDEKEEKYMPAYVDYSEKINATSDPKEKAALVKKRQDAIQPFLDKIKGVVGNLKKSYGGTYDRFRFASVVSLLTFDTGTTSGNTNEARLAKKSTFYDNRNNAYIWLAENGLNVTDGSMLGYLTTNKDGETVIKYNTPAQILAAQDALYGAVDRDVANIKTIFSENGIKRSVMYGDDYEKAKAQGKIALKAYQAEWNKKVIMALYDYINGRGTASVLNNVVVRDLLNENMFISNPYQVKQYLIKVFGGD